MNKVIMVYVKGIEFKVVINQYEFGFEILEIYSDNNILDLLSQNLIDDIDNELTNYYDDLQIENKIKEELED